MKILKDGTEIPDDAAYFVMSFRDKTLHDLWLQLFPGRKKFYDLTKGEFIKAYKQAYDYYLSFIISNVDEGMEVSPELIGNPRRVTFGEKKKERKK